jgi:G3E family GTPase
VTIITGFLGAGKTCLLNRLLSSSQLKILVIENEKGAVSVDHALVKEEAAGVIVLKNGCMCCTTDNSGASELERVLDRLVELQSGPHVSSVKEIDYILIETSGLADPSPILQTFFRKELQERFALDGVVAVVDAKHIAMHLVGGFLTRTTEAGRQVGYADVVLCNKIDISTDAECRAAHVAINAANPTANVIDCSFCNVVETDVLNRRFFDARLQRSPRLLPQPAASASASAEARGKHASAVVAITLESTGLSLDLETLQAWLQGFVTLHWQHTYRVKGLLWVRSDAFTTGEAQLFVVQGVHAELHGSLLSEDQARGAVGRQENILQHESSSQESILRNAEVRTALVIIGKGLDEPQIRKSFMETCGSTGQPLP